MQFDKLSREELLALLDVLAHNYLTIDGLWFSSVEEDFGLEKAMELDIRVSQRMVPREIKRVRKALGITEKGIQGIMKTLNLTPAFSSSRGYEEKRDGNKLTLTYTDCATQRARIDQGKGEFPCKSVVLPYFNEVIRIIDPQVKVKCLFCPPDEHPVNVWCQWQFEE